MSDKPDEDGEIKPGVQVGGWGCMAVLAIVAVLVIWEVVNQDEIAAPPAAPSTTSTSGAGYEGAARGLGIDGDAYAASARAAGMQPGEALAADLIICRETGDCPAGITKGEARATICRRTGNC